MTTRSNPVAVEETIAYHLRLAQEASFAAIRRRFGNPALKPGHYTVLSIVARNPGLTQGELSKASSRDTSTLTATLTELSKAGYISRNRSEADRRSYRITLTDAGRAHLGVLREMAVIHDAMLDEIVGTGGKAQFVATLKRIHEAFGRDAWMKDAQADLIEDA